MNPKFLDSEIYTRAKKLADKKYQKNSAYKSMFMIEQYEKMGGKLNKKLNKSGTDKWLKEKWKNFTAKAMGIENDIKKLPVCGNKHINQKNNPSICRPTKKINKTTPTLGQNFSKKQLKKALEMKKNGKRIIWDKL